MRTNRQHKPDLMTLLFVFVTLGLFLTSFAHAENYLFSDADSFSSVKNPIAQNEITLHSEVIPSSRNSWLIPGATGMRTSFKGGMAHIQFDSRDEGEVPGMMPGNTRFIVSMGWEEDLLPGNQAGNLDAAEDWYDRYKPMLYFTVGHRW